MLKCSPMNPRKPTEEEKKEERSMLKITVQRGEVIAVTWFRTDRLMSAPLREGIDYKVLKEDRDYVVKEE